MHAIRQITSKTFDFQYYLFENVKGDFTTKNLFRIFWVFLQQMANFFRLFAKNEKGEKLLSIIGIMSNQPKSTCKLKQENQVKNTCQPDKIA